MSPLETARGVYIIAATPFTDTGALDFDGANRLVEWYLERGVAGMTILGQLGEAPKLTAEESAAFARRVLARVAGRVPVVVGATSPGHATMRELADAAMQAGAAGVMIAAPGSLKGDAAVLGHYREIAAELGPDVPFVLQDYPLAGSPPMSPALIRAVAEACPRCAVLKHEDWPGLDKITAIRRQEAEGARRLAILVGNGGLFLPHELDRGADGAMTGFSYPEMLVGVCRAMDSGLRDQAMDLFDAYLPLARYEQQPGLGLAVRKHILAGRGAIASARLRLPAPRLSPETVAEIAWLTSRLERLLAAHPST